MQSQAMTEQQSMTADNQTPQFIDHPLLESIITLHIEGRYIEMANIIAHTSEQERKIMVANLNMCQCCDEHKKRKPSEYRPLPFYPPSCQEKICKCMCRHVCRDICRQHPLDATCYSPKSVTEGLQRSPASISSEEQREEDWDW